MKKLLLAFILLTSLTFGQDLMLLMSSGVTVPLAPDAPTSLAVTLFNKNVNPNLPIELCTTVNNAWNNWDIQTIDDSMRAAIVENPHIDSTNSSPSVGRLYILKTSDYSDVANGTPRGEFQETEMNLDYGKEFIYSWDDYWDADYELETGGINNAMTIAQLKHENVASPPVNFMQKGDSLLVERYIVRAGEASILVRTYFGDVSDDRGHWNRWRMEFKVDSVTGDANAYVRIYKNDAMLYSDSIRTWAQSPNGLLYCKLGLYKADWKTQPSSQDSITRYIDNISLKNVTDGTAVLLADFNNMSTNVADSITHYNALAFTKDNATDSIYVYSNTVNDTVTASKIGTTYASTYSDTVNANTYYWLKSKNDNGTSYFSSLGADSLIYTLNPPENLVTTGSPLNVDLEWTNVDDYDSIRVYRATSGFTTLASWIGNSVGTTYQDTGVYGTYYYWLRGLNDGILSDYSIGDTAQALAGSEMIADSLNINMEVTASDLITNGAFGSNITGWSGSACTPKHYNTDWNGLGADYRQYVMLDSSRGTSSVELYTSATTSAGTRYAFAIDYLTPIDTSVDGFRAQTNTGGTSQNFYEGGTTVGEWTSIKQNFTAATGTNTRLSLIMMKDGGTSGLKVADKLYFDNVSLRIIPQWATLGNHVADTTTTTKQAGSYGLKMTASGAGNGTTNTITLPSTLFTAVTDGHSYRFSIYAYTSTATTTLTFKLGDITETAVISTVGMTKLDFDFTATASSTGNIYLYVDKAATVYLDEATLKEQ